MKRAAAMGANSELKAWLISLFLLAMELPACEAAGPERSVVVYSSVDQVYSETVLKEFERRTGIHVLPVYDVEAAKTTGLVNRLIAERSRPQADVFWNGEFAQTIMLKQKDVLAPYRSPAGSDIPGQYVDSDGYWAGFAGRARVLLVNVNRLAPERYPESIFDLLEPAWPAEQVGIAYPLFGTTATHAAAIYAAIGREKGQGFFRTLRDRGVRVVEGNSVVRDLVAGGHLMLGLTDTDDACAAIERGAPVAVVFPDRDTLGTLIIPNTVALIRDAPHESTGRELIDFLLSPEVERVLVESGWCHIPLRQVGVRPGCVQETNVRGMSVSLTEVYEQLEVTKRDLTGIFIR